MPPTGLSGNNLARVRANANSPVLMMDYISFFSQGYLPDGVGGQKITRNEVWSGECFVTPYRNPMVDVQAKKEALVTVVVVTLPYTVPITNDLKALHNGFWYDIVELIDDHSQEVYRQVKLARNNKGQLGVNG